MNLFGRVNDELFTASGNCEFGGEEHCVSFDFPSSMLQDILAGLPESLSEQFCGALKRAPFLAAAGLAIELDLVAHLGSETQEQSESFIPLMIEEINASRFNPAPVAGDPNDIPQYVFKLRDAFVIREGGDNV